MKCQGGGRKVPRPGDKIGGGGGYLPCPVPHMFYALEKAPHPPLVPSPMFTSLKMKFIMGEVRGFHFFQKGFFFFLGIFRIILLCVCFGPDFKLAKKKAQIVTAVIFVT